MGEFRRVFFLVCIEKKIDIIDRVEVNFVFVQYSRVLGTVISMNNIGE